MGNTNLKEASIRSFEPNISNMSFILNDDSVLIPFISNTINKVFIDSLNKSTNLNLYNSISIENNKTYLKFKNLQYKNFRKSSKHECYNIGA